MSILLIACGLTITTAFAVAACCWAHLQEEGESQRAYLTTHPPISDADYLKLCDPSIPPEISLKVRTILSDVSGIDKKNISPDSRLIRDLGMS